MAGITNSAFRRLISDFGGYGALYTEMLSTSALLKEHLSTSPFTKRRAEEGLVIYQLKSTGTEPIEQITERLSQHGVSCIDINLGCPAPEVKRFGGGKALFDNFELLSKTLALYRSHWDGVLSVKCRLGDESPGWQERFTIRMHLFEQCGIDSVCVHPRFSDDKLKRPVRLELLAWIKSLSSLPLIVNGDIGIKECHSILNAGIADGVMIGRAAVTKPWIFACISGLSPVINYKETWIKLYNYTCEDFPPEKAIGRIKEFSTLYSKNFYFGHEFFRLVQSAPDLKTLYSRAHSFLDSDPELQQSSDSGYS
jgi:tRNA-dihydrouridine synthase